ncbi:hypothetical protein GCM10009733_003610 [Nonomuraea maheshkhaliensis]|uniref:Uncharacterized protein n=1 Tax=Nonomuraea maheshkhaliensis TaxID=419590 RepID=A0ABN2EL55_9ACTN
MPAKPLITVEPDSSSTTTELSASPTATPTPPTICAAESTIRVRRWTRVIRSEEETAGFVGALVTREVSHNPQHRPKKDGE